MSTVEYPVFTGFLIFVNVCGGGCIRKIGFLYNADLVVGNRSKKKIFLECRPCVYVWVVVLTSWLHVLTILLESTKWCGKLDIWFLEKFMQ